MLKLKSLTLTNIGRFLEPQTIDFEQLGTLIQVDGQNLNTGGSSGAGKSTIFNALDFLFGLNDVSNSLLQTRLSKQSISVIGIFDYNGQELKISRGKKLSIELDGEVTTGSAKISEEKLDLILGVSRDLFRAMLHKRQKEGGFFLAFTPKETFKFLTDCLSLKMLAAKADAVHTDMESVARSIIEVDLAIATTSASLSSSTKSLGHLGKRPDLEKAKANLIEQQVAVDRAKNDLQHNSREYEQKMRSIMERELVLPAFTSSEDKLDALYEQARAAKIDLMLLEQKQAAEKKIIESKIDGLRHKCASIMAEQRANESGHLKIEKEIGRIREQAVSFARQISDLRAKRCPTCQQIWASNEARKKEEFLLSEVLNLKQQLQDLATEEQASLSRKQMLASNLEQIIGQRHTLVSEQDKELCATIDRIHREAADIEVAISKEKEAQGRLRLAHARECDRLRNDFLNEQGKDKAKLDLVLLPFETAYGVCSDKLHMAKGALAAEELAFKRFELTSSQITTQIEHATQELARLQTLRSQLASRYQLGSEAERGIKAYTSRRFDSALASISDGATRIIRQIPNMANATIQLSATKETASGKVKEEVNAVIHNQGEQDVPIKTLSGGERTSADLAVDLAAIQFLEEQAGKGIDVFILDEPFTGLDSANIEAVVDMLKTSSLSKRIVIVDHNPVVAESFESKIIVRREGDVSRLI